MTAPVAPTPIDEISLPPTIADPENFDERSDQNLLDIHHMVPQQNAANIVTYNNALIAYNAAAAALASQAASLESKNAAADSQAAALISKASAQDDAASALASKNAAQAAATQVDVAGALAGLPPRAGNGLKAVRVNAAGNALEYYVAPLPQRLHVLSAAASTKYPLTAMLPIFDKQVTGPNYTSSPGKLLHTGAQWLQPATDAQTSVGTSPDGEVWTLRTIGASQAYVVRNNGLNVMAAYPSNPFTARRSSDGGLTWGNAATAAGVSFSPDRGAYTSTGIYAAVAGNAAMVTTDNGNTWSSLQTLPIAPSDVFALGNLLVIYSATSGTYYTSTTGLTGSWTARNLPDGIAASNVFEDGSDGLIVIPSDTSKNYWNTVDGINWVDLSFNKASHTYGAITSGSAGFAYPPIKINGIWIVFNAITSGAGGIGALVKYAGNVWTPMYVDSPQLVSPYGFRVKSNGAGKTLVKGNASNPVFIVDTTTGKCMSHFI